MSEHAVPWEETFAACLALIRRAEGGLADRSLADDPGGLTNLGITQGALAAYRKQFPADLDMPTSVRTLQIPHAERIYRKLYWEPCSCSELPPAIALIVFNAAVQSGTGRAIRWMQAALGVQVDGVMGPQTIAAAKTTALAGLVEEALTNQLLFETDAGNWNANRRGWTRRLFRTCWHAHELA